MILQALNEYYSRQATIGDGLAPSGYERKEIPFLIEIDPSGRLIQIEDTREITGKKKIAQKFLVPQGPKKSVNIVASLLWANAEYVLGLPDPRKLETHFKTGKADRYRKRLGKMHAKFIDTINMLPADVKADPGVAAVLRFLEKLDLKALELSPHWSELIDANSNLTFRLQGDQGLVCQRSSVQSAINARGDAANANGICIVTGNADEIERLHTSIKGVSGAQTSGADIVSFNKDSFNSYGKTQGANAPVGKRAAFAYTTALNRLLAKDSEKRLLVADASTVFWSEKPSPMETVVHDIFGDSAKDDPDRNVRAVESLYQSVHTGVFVTDNDSTRFYVLGLAAPSRARLTVRFWNVSTVAELARNIRQHFDDLSIVRPDYESPYLAMSRLLKATAMLGEAKNIQPSLAGDLMRSVLVGTPYPITLLQATLRRVRAEQAKKEKSGKPAVNVTYARAALIKGCLNRDVRFYGLREKELTVSLDESNFNAAYRIGRLFAVLEKIQEKANPGINTTIRDRFYGAAASTPVTVFPTLIKLNKHHLGKIANRGLVIYFENLIGEILGGIEDFPPQMSLAAQGRFAIGYYHQRQAFFKKSEASA